MAFIEPMHRNKPNITYLLIHQICMVDEKRVLRDQRDILVLNKYIIIKIKCL